MPKLRINGCVNPNCVANQKKKHYKITDEYCSKCGNKLEYVCVDCFMQLDNDNEKYCINCKAKHKDQNDKIIRQGGEIIGGIAAIGVTLVTLFKDKATDILKNK